MNLPKVIAVTAPSRRSGKGTVADVLIHDFGYTKFQFALGLKTMFVALCMYQGVEHSLIQRYLDGDLKETQIPELAGLSLRTFAEGIGTNWGRNMIGPDLWVHMANVKIAALLKQGKRIVFEDCRFANEAYLAKLHNGVVIRVVRPTINGGLIPTLPSELNNGLGPDYPYDYIFANERGVEHLRDQVRSWLIQTYGSAAYAARIV